MSFSTEFRKRAKLHPPNFDKGCHGFRSNHGRTCARRGAGFSRFLQLVPGEGESQITGKLCVLHFFYKGQLNIASLCIGRNEAKVGLQCKLLNLAIELNCCTKIPRKRHFARPLPPSYPPACKPGNINYGLHRSNDDPDVWILYENWKAPSDLATNFELPYMKGFLAVLPEVLESEMDLRHWFDGYENRKKQRRNHGTHRSLPRIW